MPSNDSSLLFQHQARLRYDGRQCVWSRTCLAESLPAVLEHNDMSLFGELPKEERGVMLERAGLQFRLSLFPHQSPEGKPLYLIEKLALPSNAHVSTTY